MDQISLSLEYWNKLAEQFIFISSLLGGFSIAVIANLLVDDANTRLSRNLLRSAVFAACSFLVSIFTMTKILMMTANGFPIVVTAEDFKISSIVGFIAFLSGIISLIALISLSGWTKSKQMGRFTTVVGSITLLIILIMLT